MRLVFAHEHHFLRGPDGRVWTETNLGRPFWNRYLAVFDSVRIVARTANVDRVKDGWIRVDGDGVTVAPIPDFLGPFQYLKIYRRVHDAIHSELRVGDAVILRVPGTIGTVAAKRLMASRYPFGVEVAGDPHDVFAPGSVRHPLRPLFRWLWARDLRQQCRAAAAALYVTRLALQRRYPAGPHRPSPADAREGPSGAEPSESSFVASNVEMHDTAFVEHPRDPLPRPHRWRLLSVGSMSQSYKGHDLTISALQMCRAQGIDAELVLIGDGRERQGLEAMAERLGLRDYVAFRGQLPSGDPVRRELDQAHVFVLASRVEGLPRALIEAMGRGLPCIGTSIGGIPELLPPEALVPPENAEALAERIAMICRDDGLRGRLSASSWAIARTYSEAELQPRREAFYRAVAKATEQRCKLLAEAGHVERL